MNRREFIKFTILSTGMVMGSGLISNIHEVRAVSPSKDLEVKDIEVEALEMEITFDTEILTLPKGNPPLHIWMPLSSSCFEQAVLEMCIESPSPFFINEDKYGNRILYVGPAYLKKGDRITVKYRIRRKKVGIIESDDDVQKHLVLSEREQWNNEILQFTKKVVGNTKDRIEIGRKIYYAILENIRFDTEGVGCGPGISVLTFENKKGRCADMHALFRTMMIYQGIPVRWRQGIQIPYPSEKIWIGELEGDCIGTHCWVEVHIEGNKWLPVDLMEGSLREDMRDFFYGNLPANRYNMSTGRNLTLNPPQKGDPLNTFPVTYAEYKNGIPLIYAHHYRSNAGYKILDLEIGR